MGFAAGRVDWALHATRSSGLQPAMDHLLAHSEEAVPDYKNAPLASATAGAGDYDEEDQAALMDMLGKKGQGAQDEMLQGAQEAKVRAQNGVQTIFSTACCASLTCFVLDRLCGDAHDASPRSVLH